MRYVTNFKESRLTARLTQQEVATLLGKTQPAIQKWESGINSPTMEDLCRLAELYDVAPGAFFRQNLVICTAGEVTAVLETKRSVSTGRDEPERLRSLLGECGAALQNVPKDFADSWIAALKACAAISEEKGKSKPRKRKEGHSAKLGKTRVQEVNDCNTPPRSRRQPKTPVRTHNLSDREKQ
jgi:transcriptional regulator with XRE-family HTH domain